MGNPMTGGCAYGTVRYEYGEKIEFAFHCRSRKCQRATGTGHASAFAVALNELKLTGEIKRFEQGSDNGARTRSGFCPTCGSPISSSTERFPDRLYLHVATLDDPANFGLKFVIYEDLALPWDYIDPALLSTK
ncbi:MAG: GFA family protein [Proteobacteria bacterium]|nr:GFA family protein [Pseudomonadota bacterium]